MYMQGTGNDVDDGKSISPSSRVASEKLVYASNMLNTVITFCSNTEVKMGQPVTPGNDTPGNRSTPSGIEIGAEGTTASGTNDLGSRRNEKPGPRSSTSTPGDESLSTSAYKNTTTYNVEVGGRQFTDAVNTIYRVVLKATPSVALQIPLPTATSYTISQRVKMNQTLADGFANYARKYSTYTADHSYMDLAAIIEQLSAMMSVYSAVGTIKWKDACGGRPVNICALQQYAVTTIPCTNSVFIPRGADNIDNPNVISAFIAATAACGAVLVTDTVATDSSGRHAQYAEISGSALAYAAYQALLLLGANYEASGASDVFVYAVVRGIHRVLSVVGHTDEGALMRRVLTNNMYAMPYGGISMSIEKYSGIPAPVSDQIRSFRCVIDAILLSSAALVAECDPGVMMSGRLMPIAYGASGEDKNMWAREHHMSLTNDIGRFGSLYITALCHIFQTKSYSGMAIQMLKAGASCERMANDRHLAYRTISPFYWIEPTGIISSPIPGVSNRSPYIGCTHYNDMSINTEMLREMELGDVWGNTYSAKIPYGNMRGNPLMMWCAMRQGDGLANIHIGGADPDGFINLGPNITRAEFMEGSEVNDLHFARLRWRCGDCLFPKPTEAMYVNSGIRVTLRWAQYGGQLTELHNTTILNIPAAHEIGTFKMRVHTTGLESVGMSDGGVNYKRHERITNRAYRAIAAQLNATHCNIPLREITTFVLGDVKCEPSRLTRQYSDSTEKTMTSRLESRTVSGYSGGDVGERIVGESRADSYHMVPEVSRNVGRQSVTIVGGDSPQVKKDEGIGRTEIGSAPPDSAEGTSQ